MLGVSLSSICNVAKGSPSTFSTETIYPSNDSITNLLSDMYEIIDLIPLVFRTELTKETTSEGCLPLQRISIPSLNLELILNLPLTPTFSLISLDETINVDSPSFLFHFWTETEAFSASYNTISIPLVTLMAFSASINEPNIGIILEDQDLVNEL